MPIAGLGGAMVIAPVPPAAGYPPSYERAKAIVRKHHPALKHTFLIELQATVGGVASQRVAVTVPAALADPEGAAGAWDGNWPGGEPATEWRFGEQLGPQPEPECPDRVDVSDAKAQAMADITKLARAYELLIAKKWIERLRRELGSQLGKQLGPELREVTGLPPVPQPTGDLVTGQLVMYNAVKELKAWAEKKVLGKNLTDVRRGNLEGLLASMAEEAMGKALCEDLFAQAEVWRGTYQMCKDDPTRKALTPYGLHRLHYHRFQICNIGEAYLQIGKTLGTADKFTQVGNKIGGTYLAKKLADSWIFAKAAYAGGTVGWAVSDLYAIVQIEQELSEVFRVLQDPKCWTTP
jgi:hypothetical protein